MVEIIFDSSFLMALAENPTTWSKDLTDILGKFQPVLLECVYSELKDLASGEGKRAMTARASLQLASGFVREPCHGAGVDEEIISAALKPKRTVATTDLEVARSLKALRIRVVTLKSGRVSVF